MPLAMKDRQCREDIFLYQTQLRSAIENCNFLRKNRCRFAHALEELRLVLESWTTTKGLYWEPGTPLLDQDILDLIEQYVASARQLPEWAQDLRAHREEAKHEEDGAPKKAHRKGPGKRRRRRTEILL